LDAHNRLLTTVAHVQGADTGPHGALVFDLDRIVEREIETDDRALGSAVEELHEHIWRVFSEAKNDNYDKLLNGVSDVAADSPQ
jgi:hypothetical protein